VVTDWDGCRDEVEDGVTGYLVPTRGVVGATANGTSRYLAGETSYPEFLAETNQTISVDLEATRDVFVRLLTDAALRARLGSAGRARICSAFTWQLAVKRHEAVWREQEQVRRTIASANGSGPTTRIATPVPFPDVETSFASYPAELLSESIRLVAAPDAEQRLATTLQSPLTSYRSARRVSEPATLARVLARTVEPRTLAEVENLLGARPASERSRATLAWLLKYDLLRVAR
jgi:hypothetical protein